MQVVTALHWIFDRGHTRIPRTVLAVHNVVEPGEGDASVAGKEPDGIAVPGREYDFRVDGRKRTILEAASGIFASEGYDGASLAAIAKACGLSQAGLLHHYPSKELLLVAVLAYRDAEAGAQINVRDVESIPGFLAAADGVAAMFAGQLHRPELIRLFVKVTAEATSPAHPAHQWATQRYFWARYLYTQMVQRDIDAGGIRGDVDAESVARELIAIMDGLQLQFLLEGPESGAAERFAAHVSRLVDSIRA